MAKFKMVFRGYDKKKVNEYIAAQEIKTQAEKDTLKRRIELLQEEIKELNEKLENSRLKEQSVLQSLIRVEKMEEESKERIEKRSQLEKERLEAFKQRWTDLVVSTCRNDHSDMMDLIDGYLAEYTSNVKKTFEEGLNLKKSESPTQQEDEDSLKLADLCRKLGILDD